MNKPITHIKCPDGSLIPVKPIEAIWINSKPRFMFWKKYKVCVSYADCPDCYTMDFMSLSAAKKCLNDIVEAFKECEGSKLIVKEPPPPPPPTNDYVDMVNKAAETGDIKTLFEKALCDELPIKFT